MKTPTLDGQTVSYVYDVNSNLTGKSRPNGVVCNTSFDALNRPERLEYAQGMGAPFFSEDYVYVKSGNLRQVKTTATGSPVKVLRYEYDDLYQFTKVEKKNGSVFDVDESYAYNEHGLPMPGSGASSGTFSPKTYQGGLSVNDDRNDSGLYLMGHRHFDADLGRFISRDPIGFRGGLNLFNGAGTSPVTYVDPSGLLETDENGAVKAEYVSSGVQTFGKEHPFEANVAQVRLRTNDGQYLIDAMILTDFDPEVQRAQTDCHGSTFTAGRFWIDNSQIEKLLMGDGYTPLTRDETPQLSDVAIYLKDGKIYHSAFVTQPGKDPMVWEKSGTREQCGFRRSTQSEGGSKPIFFRLRLPGTAPWLGFNPANEILNKVKRYLAI